MSLLKKLGNLQHIKIKGNLIINQFMWRCTLPVKTQEAKIKAYRP